MLLSRCEEQCHFVPYTECVLRVAVLYTHLVAHPGDTLPKHIKCVERKMCSASISSSEMIGEPFGISFARFLYAKLTLISVQFPSSPKKFEIYANQ